MMPPSSPSEMLPYARHLGPLSKLFAQFRCLIANPESSLDDIVRLIEADAALTARIMVIANSVYNNRAERSRTIAEAIHKIGLRDCFMVFSVVAANQLTAAELSAYGKTASDNWIESIATAACCSHIAIKQNVGDTNHAHTVGLMSMVGRVIIDHWLRNHSDTPITIVDQGFPSDYRGNELNLVGFDNAEVGAHALESWGFDASIFEPIRHQYNPNHAPIAHKAMSQVLIGARWLRRGVLIGESALLTTDSDHILFENDLDPEVLLSVLPDAKKLYEHCRSMIQS